MKASIVLAFLLGCLGFLAPTSCAAQYSLLSQISCGINGGSTSCRSIGSGFSGAISCACTARCAVPSCPQPNLSASRTTLWGSAIPGGYPCVTSLSGTATAGPTTASNPARQTALFALNVVTGYIMGGPRSSEQIDDCFGGLMQDDVPISGIC